MNSKTWALLIGLLVFAYTVPAYAAGTAVAKLVDAGIQIAVPVLVIFFSWLVHKLVTTFEKKTNFDIPAKTEEMIQNWVELGVAYAEEFGRKKLVEGAEKIKGPEKLELAANFVIDLANQYNLTNLAKDKVKQLVEAKLNIRRPE